jgi:hypothetical protein
MRYSQVRSAFAVSDLAALVDAGLVEDAYALLLDVVNLHPVAVMVDKDSRNGAFAAPMAALCARARLRKLPIERLLVAVKMAWAILPVHRTRLGNVANDVLSSAISVCIEQYFAESERLRIG